MASATAKSYFDVVLLGARLGVLAAGALLARRGFRVAWVPHHERPQGYAWRGATLLRELSAVTFADAPAFRRVAAELALGPLLRRRLEPLELTCQVALPGHRVDVRAAPGALAAELVREFPDVARFVDDYLAHVARHAAALDALTTQDLPWPPRGFFERRDAARAAAAAGLAPRAEPDDPLAGLAPVHPFREFVLGPARFTSFVDPEPTHPLGVLGASALAARRAAFVAGGRDALGAILLEKIAQHGGQLLPRDRAERVVAARGRVRAVELAGSDERLGCGFVVTSLPHAAALALAERDPSRALALRLEAGRPRYYRYVLNALVRAEGVPVGMGRRLVAVTDRSRPLVEENLLAVEWSPAPDGRAVITACALLPRSGVEEGDSYLRRQRGRVRASLAALVPFLDRNLLAIDSPHDGLPIEAFTHELPSAVEPPDRAAGAEPMLPLEPVDGESFLGLCAAPVRTDVAGLLLAGPQVVAGLGEEGELLAGLTAARIVTRTDPRKEKLRRELWSRVDF